jgi:transposase, IS30 family
VTIDARLNGKTAAETIAAMTAILQRVARCLCWSVTCYNNLRSGLSRHRLLVDLFRMSDLVLRRLRFPAEKRL